MDKFTGAAIVRKSVSGHKSKPDYMFNQHRYNLLVSSVLLAYQSSPSKYSYNSKIGQVRCRTTSHTENLENNLANYMEKFDFQTSWLGYVKLIHSNNAYLKIKKPI